MLDFLMYAQCPRVHVSVSGSHQLYPCSRADTRSVSVNFVDTAESE